jgi:DNA-binding NtrC family response regulator
MGSSKGSEPVSGFDGCRVLVVEDDYFLADDLKEELEARGAKVVGPIADLGAAQDQVSRDDFDVAVINVKLGNKLAWSIADELMRANIPFGFITGYGAGSIPERFRHIVRWEKPCNMSKLTEDIPCSVPFRKRSIELSARGSGVSAGHRDMGDRDAC